MRAIKLSVLAAFVLVAFGAVGTAVASAEDAGSPSILCLAANCITSLEASGTGGAASLATLSGLEITGTATKATIKGCEAISGTEGKDGNLCKSQTITITGVKSKGVSCKSEGAAAGEVVVLGNLHLASEESEGKLEPLGLGKIRTAASETGVLVITCGVIKEEVKGTIGCLLLPGLANTTKAEIVCKQNTTSHDKETGKCEQLCEWLEKEPLEAKLGEKFEDAWLNVKLSGEANKDVFVDD